MYNMKLFRSQYTQDSAIPPELQPYYAADTVVPRVSRLTKLLVLLAFIVVLVLALLAGRFLWHVTHTHTSNLTPSSKSQLNQSPNVDNSPKSSGTPAKTPASNTTNNTNVTLPNTGG